MNAVVDTNVVAYYLLGTEPFVEETRHGEWWRSPLHQRCGRLLPTSPSTTRLFVELAYRQSLPLVTFDAKILKAFPDVACRPGALVSG